MVYDAAFAAAQQARAEAEEMKSYVEKFVDEELRAEEEAAAAGQTTAR